MAAVRVHVRAAQPFLFIAVGLDLEASGATPRRSGSTRSSSSAATTPPPTSRAQPVESFIETAATGNIFTNPANGLALTVRAFNDSDSAQTVRGKLAGDGFLRPTPSSRASVRSTCRRTRREPCVPAAFARASRVSSARRGRLACHGRTPRTTTAAVSTCAARSSTPAGRRSSADSPLGFNHAYPWDFLVRLAREAGIVWWRDWSAKWQTVEPEKGKFDFTAADAQIQRVLDLDSEVDVLLPFPSAAWSTTAPDRRGRQGRRPEQLPPRSRCPCRSRPADPNDFGRLRRRGGAPLPQPPARAP